MAVGFGSLSVQMCIRDRVKPDFAIVFEGSPADDPYYSASMAQCRMRQGVQIRHMDNSYVANSAFIRYAHEIGGKFGIPYRCV